MKINKKLIEDIVPKDYLVAENSDYSVYKAVTFDLFHNLAGQIVTWAAAQSPTAFQEMRKHGIIIEGKTHLWYHVAEYVLIFLPKHNNLDPYYVSVARAPATKDIPGSKYSLGVFQFYDKYEVPLPPNVVPPKVNFPEVPAMALTIKPVARIHNGLEIDSDTRTLVDVGPEVSKLIVPDGIRTVGDSCCKDFLYLRQVRMPDTVLYIEPSAFYGCRYLTSVELSNSIQTIGASSFLLCDSLTSLDLPNGITEIGDKAFAYMRALPKIKIPDSVKKLGEGIFFDCKELREVELPAGIQQIPPSFFAKSGIKNFTIPNSVTTIGRAAFSTCKQLTQIYIPASVTEINDYAFRDCNKRITIHYDGTQEQLLTVLAKRGAFMSTIFDKNTKIACKDGIFNFKV